VIRVAGLRAHRVAQVAERLAIGAGYRDDDLVFAKVDGTPLHPQYVSTTFERLSGQVEVPRIRLHDLRHTCATLLLEQGVALKIVSERLGHSSITITADAYQHATEQMQTDAAAGLGTALFGS
jgi:integrase